MTGNDEGGKGWQEMIGGGVVKNRGGGKGGKK